MPLAKTRLLPPLSEEWNELEAAVTRAAGLGRSDREQALASRGAAQP
jgi:hypothetical protein